MTTLEQVKVLLGITTTALDSKLNIIIANTEKRLLAKLDGETEIPDGLSYIVTEVAIARFNKIGSEGATSHSVEGESLSFMQDEFSPYAEEIDEWLANREEGSGKGRVVFL